MIMNKPKYKGYKISNLFNLNDEKTSEYLNVVSKILEEKYKHYFNKYFISKLLNSTLDILNIEKTEENFSKIYYLLTYLFY